MAKVIRGVRLIYIIYGPTCHPDQVGAQPWSAEYGLAPLALSSVYRPFGPSKAQTHEPRRVVTRRRETFVAFTPEPSPTFIFYFVSISSTPP